MYSILIVDDEKIEREGIKLLIERYNLGLIQHEAEDGQVALEYIQANHVDILITDIRMPFMDGLELIQKSKIINPTLKVIIFSAYGEFDYAKRAIGFHVNSYILKPILESEFLNVMTDVINDCKNGDETAKIGRKADDIDKEKESKTIRTVLEIIENDYHKYELSLEYISEKVYLTPTYLSFLFKRDIGQTLVRYITNYRLKKAAELLNNTNFNVSDISKMVGYPNLSYFCKIFNCSYGMSPAKFRDR